MEEPQEAPIVFKKKAKRNLRVRIEDEEDDDLGVDLSKLNDLKELREFKKNQLRGLSAEELLSLKSEANDRVQVGEKSKRVTGLVSNDVDLVATFSHETNRRDEDADMLKFIEEELAKRKGKKEADDESKKVKSNADLEEMVFSELPEHLLKANRNKNEEMLSNQMLSGIPEVPLGVEEKIRNIERTEEAKKRASSAVSRSSKETSFVPNNMAVNYVQHNKFSLSENTSAGIHHQAKKPKIEPVKLVKEPVVVIGDEPKESLFKVQQHTGDRQLKHPGREHASDNYHYERFKKSFKK